MHTPVNNASTTVATARSSGAPSLVVASGAVFGSVFPIYVTAVRAGVPVTILEVTARSGNTLTVVGGVDGSTDAALLVGDTVQCLVNAGYLTEVQTAITANTAAIAGNTSSIGTLNTEVAALQADDAVTVHTTGTYADPAWITSLAGSKVVGNIAGSAGGLTAAIAESQVTNLVADLAGKQPAGAYLTSPIAESDVTGLVSALAGKQPTGAYLTGNQTITLSTDLSGSGTTTLAATITAKAVTLAKMDDMATASFLGRNTAGAGAPEVLSEATVKTMLGLGTAAFVATTAFDAAGAAAAITLAGLGGAPLASPSLTGTPLAPTAINGTNNTQIASTAFVHSYVASLGYITGLVVGTTAVSGGGANQVLYQDGSGVVNSSAALAWDGTNLVALTGAAGASPVVFRQTGGTAGTNEVQVSHTGTQTLVKSLTGPVRVQAPNTGSTDYFDVYDNSGNAFFLVTATVIRCRNGISDLVDGGGVWSCADSGGIGTITVFGQYVFRPSVGGTPDTGLARGATAIVKVTNASTGYGSLQAGVTDSGTTTTPTGLQTGHNTSGTAAAGFGVTHLFVAQDSTTVDQNVGRIVAKWGTATHASRQGQVDIAADDWAGTRVVVSAGANGTVGLLGFFATTPVVQQTGDIATALSNYGLVTSPLLFLPSGTSGRVPYETTSGQLTDSANLTFLAGGFAHSVALGEANSTPLAIQQWITGYLNTVTSTVANLIVHGVANTASGGAHQVFGVSNNISASSSSYAFGIGNTVSASVSLALGNSNSVTSTGLAGIGNSNAVSGSRSIATGTLSSVTRAGVFNYCSFDGDPIFNLQRQSSTTVRDVFDIRASYVVNTDASRTTRAVYGSYDWAGFREVIRHEATGTAGALSFFAAAAVAQQTAAAVTTGYSAGSSTAVTIDGTFTGNVGSTAYTLADVIAALKKYGLLVT